MLILCVDDYEFSLWVRRLVLEQNGYQVATATNGAEALEIFSTQPVSLAVVDYYLPDITGDALAASFKRLHPQTPVILLSGSIDLPVSMPAVDICLGKAESPEVLLHTLASLLPPGSVREEAQRARLCSAG